MNPVLLVHVPGLVVAAVDPSKVKPGPIALIIVLLLGLATYLLWRSMNRQLKKVHFEDAGAAGNGVNGGARGTRGNGRVARSGDDETDEDGASG
jgi:hypothetical protein